MKYKHFRITNFKGIKDTTVELGDGPAAIFPLVGLNESGKTTILEAIHSFSPDTATSELVGDKGSGVPVQDRVPRHLISTFTGSVSVAATLSVSDKDKDLIESRLLKEHQIQIDKDRIPSEVTLDRQHVFQSGDYKAHNLVLKTEIFIKKPKAKKWRQPEDEGERRIVRDAFYAQTPDIAYFPTFVFDFPKEIFLTDRGSKIDRFYYRVFQDVLDYDNKGHSIETSIVRRVRSENLILSWLEFWTKWAKMDDEKNKIQHVMDRAGAVITQVVFKRWNEIFGEDAKGKEVVISYEVVEGTKRDKNGAVITTNEHDVHIKFQIRDGTRRFDVNDRSLGFRWFFAFMMFTQFRVARKDGVNRPMLFLFDEPASNLHSAAQQKLIDSFPEIVKGDHTLMYTTHSHYMIEPKWLEQTFIVTNRSDAPLDSVLDAVSLDDESLDVKANRYRSFIATHPNKTSYFQPILDRLEVVPSGFDIKNRSIVVEGKSDYYILRYAKELLNKSSLSLIPGLGAGTFDALIALHIGWNLKFLFILDDDKQGAMEKGRYEKKFGIPSGQIFTIAELEPTLKEIEDLFDKTAKATIQSKMSLSKDPNKAQILRFCQEHLASGNIIDLGPSFAKKAATLLDNMEKYLAK